MAPGFSECVASRLLAPMRRSALLLHSLCQEDRAWILERLPQTDRAGLTQLLGELQELGIPADHALMDSALQGLDAQMDLGAAGAPGAPHADGAAADGDQELIPMSLLSTLSGARQRALIDCLNAEPPGVAAVLLALHPWPWRADVEAQLPHGAVHALHCADGAGARLGPALARAVLERIDSRMAQGMQGPPTPKWATKLLARGWLGRPGKAQSTRASR